MAKSSKPAFRLFGGLFGTKAGFVIVAAIIVLVIAASRPGYLSQLLNQLLAEVGQPLISLAVIAFILGYGIKKLRGH